MTDHKNALKEWMTEVTEVTKGENTRSRWKTMERRLNEMALNTKLKWIREKTVFEVNLFIIKAR